MSIADVAWGSFVGAGAIGFVVLEITGWKGAKQGTLTGTLRRWLGIDPPAIRRWFLGTAFGAGLVLLGVHILTGWL